MLIPMEFSTFGVDQNQAGPLIILREINGARILPIPANPLEASAVAVKTLSITAQKPLTIDVAQCILEELSGSLARVIIEPEKGNSLAARLEITAPDHSLRRIACRPCDAIALALRCKAPLLARETAFAIVSDGRAPERSEGELLREQV